VVDELGTPGVAPDQPAVPAAVGVVEPKPSFLSTTAGKVVIGGIVVLVVLGALAAIAIVFVFGQGAEDATDAPVVTQETSATASGGDVETPTERPAAPLEDTFAFRNIFQPTIKVTLTPVEDDGTTDGTTVDVPENTLYLVGVSTVDGEPVAELIWNGETYFLSEGDTIAGTPWKVLSISGDTVVMLYGDTRVTLTVGQGISK